MTQEEIDELNREFSEMWQLVAQLSELSHRVHVAAEKALDAYQKKGEENGDTKEQR